MRDWHFATQAVRRYQPLGWGALLLVTLAGVMHGFSIAWPLDMAGMRGHAAWPLQWLALAVLCWRVRHAESAKQAAWLAGMFACTWLVATFWWLYIAMHVYGGMVSVLAAVAVLLLAAFLSSYYVLAMYALRRWNIYRPLGWVLAFASAWTLADGARNWVLTGFGWGGVGYAWVDSPLAMVFPLAGVFGVGWLAAALAAVPAVWGDLSRRRQYGLLGGLLVVGLLGWVLPHTPALQFTSAAGSLQVDLLQGNIPQDEKFETGSGVPLALDWYAQQLRQSKADLVVAPETAIPLLPAQLPPSYWQDLQRSFQVRSTAALVGIPLGDALSGYTNSMLALSADPASQQWQYHKHHLVPFGEFIPPAFKWFMRLMHIPLDSFNRGDLGQAPFEFKGQRLAPNICYEDLYSEEIASRFVGAQQPTILINVSNLAWFGDSVAIDQHLAISRVRALEFQRPILRATNTGATAVVDHHGRVTAALPNAQRDVLHATVQGRNGLTPYALWVSAWGLWPLWVACAGIWFWLWRRQPLWARRDS